MSTSGHSPEHQNNDEPGNIKYHDDKLLKQLIADKDSEITRVRSDYYRLVEQFKTQVQEKQTIVEALTNQDAALMKEQLLLRNKTIELEKKNDKV